MQREHISCFALRNGIFLSALRASPERPGASRSRKTRNFSSGASRDWSAAITPFVTRLVHSALSAQLKNGHLRLRRIARLTRWHYVFMEKMPRVSLRHFAEPKMSRSLRALRHSPLAQRFLLSANDLTEALRAAESRADSASEFGAFRTASWCCT